MSKNFALRKTGKLAFASLLLATTCGHAVAADKPNIVLILMDNFGWGEVGAYGGGILRGAPTPNIDSIADNGLKLLNFNVESQCVPSRSALMTGRYAIRSGTSKVPLGAGVYGMTQWEYTLPEMLSDAGYKTAMYGKWHLGDSKGRYPTDQGFDEWYGVPNSTDESYWPDNDLFRAGVHPQAKFAHVMKSTRGKTPKNVALYNSAKRKTVDKEFTDLAVKYIKKNAKGSKPFFLYIPYTQTHMPVDPHPDYKGKTGNGGYADVLAQTDAYVGAILGEVKKQGIEDNTIFIFTSDNGPEGFAPHEGFSGPWRGTYFTGLEASLRVPFLIQWPGKIKADTLTNDIVHEMDLFATFAKIAGGKVPKDRIIDSVDMTDFFTGKAKTSGRESVVVYNGTDVYGVKWRNWKMMIREISGIASGESAPPRALPTLYNLLQDPKEQRPMRLAPDNLWVRYPASQVLIDHAKSLGKEPPIKAGTPDPYVPKAK